MTELKTLKDFGETIIGYKDDVPFKDTFTFGMLKAEAVKWVKDELAGYPDIYNTNDDFNAVKRFIKHFFNLTEADLQEGTK